jgi:hypothetical protein
MGVMATIRAAAIAIGLLMLAVGGIGMVDPSLFIRILQAFQSMPAIYAAAALRLAIGAVLLLAAPASRAPRALRGLGVLVVLGGLLTPFLATSMSRTLFEWWTRGGPSVIRAFAAAALVVGTFVVFATWPRRPAG